LAQQGVRFIIAGGMGSRAQQLFANQGVKVVTAAQKPTRDGGRKHLKGTLVTGG